MCLGIWRGEARSEEKNDFSSPTTDHVIGQNSTEFFALLTIELIFSSPTSLIFIVFLFPSFTQTSAGSILTSPLIHVSLL